MTSLSKVADALATYLGYRPRTLRLSERSDNLRESRIRNTARLVNNLSAQHPLINLGQGLPEFPPHQALKDAAKAAIDGEFNQYLDTWGYAPLRRAIADKLARYNGIKANPDTEITVTCGASEALHLAAQLLVQDGDEMIVFEPYYETYEADLVLAAGAPRFVRLHAPEYHFDPAQLEKAFNRRTRAILLTTPHNPTGRVFTREELEQIARLCQKWNVVAIADEIYEYLVYDGKKHISLATIPGMEDRTITISGLSKTFSVTGWRLGYMHAAPELTKRLRRMHDYVTLGAPSPLQVAAVTAINMPDSFYGEVNRQYQDSRDQLAEALKQAGLNFRQPEGAYYIFADAAPWGFSDDRQAWEYLLREFRLVSVPGSCFYRPGAQTTSLRFCFAKKPQTIAAGAAALLSAAAARTDQTPKNGG
jgi:aspartate/methionine/tyrosine aminotransferase